MEVRGGGFSGLRAGLSHRESQSKQLSALEEYFSAATEWFANKQTPGTNPEKESICSVDTVKFRVSLQAQLF